MFNVFTLPQLLAKIRHEPSGSTRINYCNGALKMIEPKASPNFYEEIIRTLSFEYTVKKEGLHAENMDTAIEILKNAIKNLKEIKGYWIGLETILGTYYLKRPNGIKGENAEKALACFKNVEKYYDEKSLSWWKLQEAIGLALLFCHKGNKKDNIESAIDKFVKAFSYIKKEEEIVYWIELRINLGIGYSLRVEGNPSSNSKLAFKYFQEADDALRDANIPSKRYYEANLKRYRADLLAKSSKKEDIRSAMDFYAEALNVFLEPVFPIEYRETVEGITKAGNKIGLEVEINAESCQNCSGKG